MGRKNKIEKLGTRAEQIVLQERARDESLRDIASKIEEEFNVEKISKNSVDNYLKKADPARARMTERNIGELEKERWKEILDTSDQLEKLNDKMNEALEELDATDRQDMGLLRQVAKEIRQQLEFQKNLQQQFENKMEINNYDIDNNVTAIEINRHLRELEDQGVIEVKDPSKLEL